MICFPIVVPGSPWANGYLVWDESSGQAYAVDPDLTGGLLEATLSQQHLTLQSILLTHGHFDHIASAGALKRLYPEAQIAIHRLDADKLTDSQANLSAWQGQAITAPAADRLLEEGEELHLGGECLRVIHTPGHTPGSVCFYAPGYLFSGDTLFCMGVGRWDFPGGDGQALISGIQTKLMVLPDGTQVFPGHGPATTIAAERMGNPYLEAGR